MKMNARPNRKEILPTAASTHCPHCRARLGRAPLNAGDWEPEERSGISGLKMAALSIALVLLLVGVLLAWQWLPAHYVFNYLAGAMIWLLGIGIPVVALVALVSSVMDLFRVSGTEGKIAGKGSAVAGLILSALVLTLCAFFFLGFKKHDSDREESAVRPREHFTAKGAFRQTQGEQSAQREKEILNHELHEIHEQNKRRNHGAHAEKRGHEERLAFDVGAALRGRRYCHSRESGNLLIMSELRALADKNHGRNSRF
jgi:hypothetical protein